MANEKIFNARLKLKYDTLAGWGAVENTFIPLKGEVCIVEVPTGGDANVTTKPAILFKVGDGVKDADTGAIKGTTFGKLDWVSARAADVYDWAKKVKLEYADLPEELKAIVAGDLTIGEEKYNSLKEYVDAKTAGIATDAALENLNKEVTALKTKAENTETKANANEAVITAIKDGTTVDSFKDVEDNYITKEAAEAAIADAKKAGTDAQAAVTALEGKIGTVPEDKTVVQMIADAKTEATYDDTDVKASIKTNADAIAILNGNTSVDGSVDKKINDAFNDFATKVSDDNVVNTYKELVDYAAKNGGDMATLTGKVTANEGAIATLNGDENTAGSVKKTVADALAESDLSQYAKADALTALEAKVDVEKVSTAIGTAKTELIGIDEDTKDSNTIAGAKKYADAKAEEITANLATVATTGKIDDLIQEGYFILDGGSATVNV